jgi:hypothetical protein
VQCAVKTAESRADRNGISVDYGGRPTRMTQWPKARPIDTEIAPTGAYDCAWVELDGRIRPIHTESGALVTFDLMTALGPVTAKLVLLSDVDRLRGLIDAKVRVHGVFATLFTNRQELIGYRLLINSMDQVEVLQPPSVIGRDAPIRPIAALMQYSGEMSTSPRARIRGRVTASVPGYLYVEDDSGINNLTDNSTPLFEDVGTKPGSYGGEAIRSISLRPRTLGFDITLPVLNGEPPRRRVRNLLLSAARLCKWIE